MLAEEDSVGRFKKDGSTLRANANIDPSKSMFAALGFGVVKSIRTVAALALALFLLQSKLPVTVALFFIFLTTAIPVIPLASPLLPPKRISTPKLWRRIITFSILCAVNMYFWVIGLRDCGPIRTFLLDYCDLALAVLLGFVINGQSASSKKIYGAVICIAATVLPVFLQQSQFGTPWNSANVETLPATTEKDSVSDGEVPHAPFDIDLGVFVISETFIGTAALLFSTLLTFVRKHMGRQLGLDVGGPRRLYPLSNLIGAFILFPFAGYQFFTMDDTIKSALYQYSGIGILVLSGLFMFALDFFVESSVDPRSHPKTAVNIGFVVSFSVGTFASYMWHYQLNWIDFVAFAMTFHGIDSLCNYEAVKSELPLHKLTSDEHPQLHSFAGILSVIMSQKDSRNIFMYLSLNFAFMFMELFYGFWSNSLGLISDSFHMLFDCMALAIGLYASVMAKWKPNRIYSYGYGRFEVLSGFVNGIFLVFISFFLLLEAIERVFEPPEINTDRLLLVSVIGFCVNMVGMCTFHNHDTHNHNVEGVFLHILADTLGSVGVIISSVLVQFYGMTNADTVCSIIISVLTFLSVLPLIKNTGIVLLQRTPPRQTKLVDECLNRITTLSGVIGYDHAHFWSQTDDLLIGSIHVQVTDQTEEQEVLVRVFEIFQSLGVAHLAVQVEKNRFFSRNLQHNLYQTDTKLQVRSSCGHDHDHDHSHDHHHDHSHDHKHTHHHEHGPNCSHNHEPNHGHNHSHSHNHSHGDGHEHGPNCNHKHDVVLTPKETHVHGPNCNHGHSHNHKHDVVLTPKETHVHGPNCNHGHSHGHNHHHQSHHQPSQSLTTASSTKADASLVQRHSDPAILPTEEA